MSRASKADERARRGDPAALDPHLPDTWYRVAKSDNPDWPYRMWPWRRRDHRACVSRYGVWEAEGSDGGRESCRLDAMGAADRSLEEGEA